MGAGFEDGEEGGDELGGAGEADGDGSFGSDVVGGGEVVGELVGLLV